MEQFTNQLKRISLLKCYRKILLIMVFVCAGMQTFAQGSISGTVFDDSKLPLPGVTVLVKGSTAGTITDMNGTFTLQATTGDILVFSFIGFVPEELQITDLAQPVSIMLIPDLIGLDEVVIVGYGSQRKSDVTSAAVTIKSDEFIQGAVKDAGQLLQGKIAGLSVTTTSGDPSQNVEIMLRGVNSLKSSVEPLVIVDGVEGDLKTVAPQDIESVDVLKDGSSAAIYGSRGSGGVIIITTKKGTKNMPLTTEYNTYVSTQTYSKKAGFYTADDYHRLANDPAYQKLVNDKVITAFTDYGNSTDWLDEISRTPLSHNHDLRIMGGTEKTQYTGSMNIDKRQGMIINSDYQKMTGRMDITHLAFNDYLKINLGLISSMSKNNPVDKSWAYRQALIRNPTDVVSTNGVWEEHIGEFQYENPVALLNEADGITKDNNARYYGNFTLSPVKGLDLKASLSRSTWNSMYGYYETKNHISTVRDNQNGVAQRSASASVDNLLELTADYKKIFGGHEVNGLIGYSYKDNYYETFYARNTDFPNDFFTWNNLAQGQGMKAEGDPLAEMTSYASMNKLIGGFARLNYTFNSKYLATVSIRREGSTKFGENHQWGNFPAVQAGWKISEEQFMSNLDFLNFLKLRVGYGVTGTEPYDPYKSLVLMDYDKYVYYNGQWIKTVVPVSNPNPDLKWERKTETNIGIDFAMFNNRLSGNIDLYKRYVNDMLWEYSVPSPPYLYSTMLANVGEMENKGIEIFIEGAVVKTDDFKWTTSATYSTNKNKLVTLSNELFQTENNYVDAGGTGDPIQQSTHRLFVGGAVGDFWGYKTVGIDSTGTWLIETPEGKIGRIDTCTTADKQVLGNGIPKHYLSWNNNFVYKNFDLSITMRGAFGFQILNSQRMFYENPTIAYNMLNTAHDLVYGTAILTYPQEYVSYYVEDGDYWKIDNVTLGYNYKPKNTDYIKNIRVYASALNLLTISGYKGIDPEVRRTGMDPGVDSRDKFPSTRSFTVGLNFKF